MNTCQSCGKQNAESSQFCRYCGVRLLQQYSAPQQSGDPNTRRPYSWQTDEFQTNAEARRTRPEVTLPPLGAPAAPIRWAPQPFAANGPQHIANANYHCPRCGTSALPIVERRVSTAGWITFGLLLAFTLIFFWIGLLIKEDGRKCPLCGFRLA